MKFRILFSVLVLFIFTANLEAQNNEINRAVAKLIATEGNEVKGTATFEKQNNGIKIIVEIEGLKPGKHGIHIHEYGDCSAEDGSSAGGHYNPGKNNHGGPFSKNRHVGDLGNITVKEDGSAKLVLLDKVVSFEGLNSIIGRALIIHDKEDDLKSQPTGEAGARLACGVIGVAK